MKEENLVALLNRCTVAPRGAAAITPEVYPDCRGRLRFHFEMKAIAQHMAGQTGSAIAEPLRAELKAAVL